MIRRKDQMLEESNSHFANNNSEGIGSRELVYVYSSPRVKKEPVDEDSEDMQVTELAGRKGTIQVPKPRYYYYAYHPEKGISRVHSSKAKSEGELGQGDTCNQDNIDQKFEEIHDSRYWPPPSIRDRDGHSKSAYIICDQNSEQNSYHIPPSTRGKHRYIYPSAEYRQRSPRRSPEHGNHSPFEVPKPFEDANIDRGHSPEWKEEEYHLDPDRKEGIKIQNEGQPVHLRKLGEAKVRKEQAREPYVVVHPGSYYYPEDLPPDVPYRYERREYVYRPESQNERYSPVRVVHTRDLAGKNYKLHQRIPESKPVHPGYHKPPSKRPSETGKPVADSNKEHPQNAFQGEYHGEYYNPPNVTLINRPESGDYVMYGGPMGGQDVEYPRHHNRSTPSTEDENQSGNEGEPPAPAVSHHRSSADNKGDNRSSADNKSDNKARHFEVNSEDEHGSNVLSGPRGERDQRLMETPTGPTGTRREHYSSPHSPVARRYPEPYMIYPGKARPPSNEGTKRKYHEAYGRDQGRDVRDRDYHGPTKVIVNNEEYRPRRCVVYQVPAYPGCCCPCCPCATVPRPEQTRPPQPTPPPPHPTHSRVSPRPVPPQRPNPPLPQSPPTNNMISYPRRRRNRTVYTNDQIVELEEVFKLRHYLDVDEKSSLAAKLKVRTENVEIWFKNRRAKWRREMKAMKSGVGDDGESDDSPVEEGTKEEDDKISNNDYHAEENNEEDDAHFNNLPLIKIEMKEVTEDDHYKVYVKKEPDEFQDRTDEFQDRTEVDTSTKE